MLVGITFRLSGFVLPEPRLLASGTHSRSRVSFSQIVPEAKEKTILDPVLSSIVHSDHIRSTYDLAVQKAPPRAACSSRGDTAFLGALQSTYAGLSSLTSATPTETCVLPYWTCPATHPFRCVAFPTTKFFLRLFCHTVLWASHCRPIRAIPGGCVLC